MWIVKLRVRDNFGIIPPLAKKYLKPLNGYLMGAVVKDEFVHLSICSHLDASVSFRDDLVSDMSSIPYFESVKVGDSDVLFHFKIPASLDNDCSFSAFFDPNLIQVRPFTLSPEGWGEIEFASFNRDSIERLLELAEKKHSLSLIRFCKADTSFLRGPIALPSLTKKQSSALLLAISKGYYSYPRKVSLVELAKLYGSSFSTFREHLRRAESRLIPYLFDWYT